jgi:ribosomal protein S6E (S10)
MIGPLASSERLMRVQRYMFKKHKIILKTKYSYQCRKSVADKRLRIKGRFVTQEQAFEILGLS